MLRIENLKLPPGSGDAALRAQVLKVLRLPEERLLALRILRRSIDAREGVHWVYTVEAETQRRSTASSLAVSASTV